MPRLVVAILAICFISRAAFAEPEVWSLQPVIVEGLPSEALAEDSIVPSLGTRSTQPQGSGGIQRSLENRLPYSISDSGLPGTLSTLRGLGRSADENSVEAFGVALNPPQGGGFDLGVFPQFLWTGSRFRLGPSLTGLDPRAFSGTLSLTPWTQEALGRGTSGARLSQTASSVRSFQTSAGAVLKDRVAAVAGMSLGDAEGPSGAVSARWKLSESVSGKVHLVATWIDAVSQGSTTYPTPGARSVTARGIPVAQVDARLGGDALWKSSAFYDATRLRYDDPEHGTLTRDRIDQYGAQTALLFGTTRIGGSFRHVRLSQLGFEAPAEVSGSLQLSRAEEWGAVLVEPTLQGVGVSRQGFLPAGSLGVRWSPAPVAGVRGSFYGRLSYSLRFASLIDRFYRDPAYGIEPNPELQPERAMAVLAGTSWGVGNWESTLEAFIQFRQDARVSSPPTYFPQNDGSAQVSSLAHRLGLHLGNGVSLRHALTLASSRLERTGEAFPFIPGITEVLGVSWSSSEKNPGFSALASVRAAGPASSGDPNTSVGGYAYLDLGGRIALTRGLQAELSVENVADRPIELTPGFPMPGRVFSVALVGEID